MDKAVGQGQEQGYGQGQGLGLRHGHAQIGTGPSSYRDPDKNMDMRGGGWSHVSVPVPSLSLSLSVSVPLSSLFLSLPLCPHHSVPVLLSIPDPISLLLFFDHVTLSLSPSLCLGPSVPHQHYTIIFTHCYNAARFQRCMAGGHIFYLWQAVSDQC